MYRHAHAYSLFDRRRSNVRAALERIIEKAGDVEVTASAIVAAVQMLTRITSGGQLIEPRERLTMRQLFERMSPTELDLYAKTGQLPDWFKALTN